MFKIYKTKLEKKNKCIVVVDKSDFFFQKYIYFFRGNLSPMSPDGDHSSNFPSKSEPPTIAVTATPISGTKPRLQHEPRRHSVSTAEAATSPNLSGSKTEQRRDRFTSQSFSITLFRLYQSVFFISFKSIDDIQYIEYFEKINRQYPLKLLKCIDIKKLLKIVFMSPCMYVH